MPFIYIYVSLLAKISYNVDGDFMKKLSTLLLGLLYILLTLALLIQFNLFEVFNIWIKAIITIITLVFTIYILRFYTKTLSRKMTKKYDTQKRKRLLRKQTFLKVLILLLCIALSFANYFYYRVNDTFNYILNNNGAYHTVHVYALKDSPITTLSDLKDKKIGYTNQDENYGKDVLVKVLNKEFNLKEDNYSLIGYLDTKKSYEALKDSKVDIIVIDDATLDSLLSTFTTFESSTKLIKTIKGKVEIESKSVSVTTTPFNVLIAGVDNREEDGSITANTRADTIIIATINPKTQEILLTSIPRDTFMPVSCNNNIKDKATHITRKGGIQCLISSLENYLDIEINYYLKFDFQALVKLIDTVGNIKVDVAYPFCEMDSNDKADSICLKAGSQNLNGEQALAYARHRKTVTDGRRSEAQQLIIKALVKKMASPTIVTKFDSVLKIISDHMQTNLSRSEMYDLVSLVPSMGNLSFENSDVLKGDDAYEYIAQYKETMYVMKIPQDKIDEAGAKIRGLINKK